jgi:aminopeptidase N
MEPMDIHSWSRPDLIRVRHLELDLDVDFDRRVLEGSATLHLDRLAGSELVLDTRGLEIHSVENAASFELGAADPILALPSQ